LLGALVSVSGEILHGGRRTCFWRRVVAPVFVVARAAAAVCRRLRTVGAKCPAAPSYDVFAVIRAASPDVAPASRLACQCVVLSTSTVSALRSRHLPHMHGSVQSSSVKFSERIAVCAFFKLSQTY